MSFNLEKLIREYACREDLWCDEKLVKYDVLTLKSHNLMLWFKGLLRYTKLRKILISLNKIEKLSREGKFKLKEEFEDVHMNIEAFIIKDSGLEVGGMIQFGRSRNDQVLTDIRMYLRDEILKIINLVIKLMNVFLRQAEENVSTIMPAYTHLQPAQPSTFAHWCLSYVDTLFRSINRLNEVLKRVNLNPLGAAAVSGAALPLDRELTASLLGFSKIQENTLDVISSRGEIETEALCVLSLLMTSLSRLASELILFSTFEFGFIKLGDLFTTGSSLMPQKRNPDIAELIRGKTGRIYGYLFQNLSILKDLPSGYSRDMQETKLSLFKALEIVESTLKITSELMKTVQVNKERMLKVTEQSNVTSTELINLLVSRGVSFRQAYLLVKEIIRKHGNLASMKSQKLVEEVSLQLGKRLKTKRMVSSNEIREALNPKTSVELRKVTGGPAPEEVRRMIEHRKKEISVEKKKTNEIEIKIRNNLETLNKLVNLVIEGKNEEKVKARVQALIARSRGSRKYT